MCPSRDDHAGGRGFTLVEVLATIGIIALLIGIATPAIAHARKSAQAAFCRAKLKEMGTFVFAEVSGSGMFPAFTDADMGFFRAIHDEPPLRPELFEPWAPTPTTEFARCPSDRKTFYDRGTSYRYETGLKIRTVLYELPLSSNIIDASRAVSRQIEIKPDWPFEVIVRELATSPFYHHTPKPDNAEAGHALYHDGHVDWDWTNRP